MHKIDKTKRILFATFSPYKNNKRLSTNGNVEPMIDFFAPRIKAFTLIDQPHPGSTEVIPRIEAYEMGKLKKKYFLQNTAYKPFYSLLSSLHSTERDTSILYKLRDLVSVFHLGLAAHDNYNYFIGFESINTLAGIILKKLGKIEYVIYYVSDYSPVRYDNKIFNWIYLTLDRICCYSSDFIWDVSLAMHPARIKAGLDKKKSAPRVHVSNALFPNQIKYLPINKIHPYTLVFMGTLGYDNGPDLAIDALGIVLKKFPKTVLHIIGKGEEELERLKKHAFKLHLKKHIVFHGFIPNNEEMLSLVRQFQIGLAPYLKVKNSVRWYGDSLKLRAYMASGIPVITTEVPPLGRELERSAAARIIADNKNDLAKEIILIFSNKKLYQALRKNAINFGKNNIWENTYSNAFITMEKYHMDHGRKN